MKSLNRKLLGLVSVVALVVPILVSAAPIYTKKDGLKYVIQTIIDYFNQAVYLLIGVAVVIFIFYVVKYFMTPADGAERSQAAQYVMWAVIGFFVILAFWGLVNIVRNTFNLDEQPQSISDFQNIIPK